MWATCSCRSLGAWTGGLDFSNHFIALSSAVNAPRLCRMHAKQGAVLAWGNFLTIAVNFIIVAIVLFLVVRAINTLRRNTPPAPAPVPAPARSEVLLEDIRDLLAKRPTVN